MESPSSFHLQTTVFLIPDSGPYSERFVLITYELNYGFEENLIPEESLWFMPGRISWEIIYFCPITVHTDVQIWKQHRGCVLREISSTGKECKLLFIDKGSQLVSITLKEILEIFSEKFSFTPKDSW